MNCQATILTFCQSAILEQCVLGKFATFVLKYIIIKLYNIEIVYRKGKIVRCICI